MTDKLVLQKNLHTTEASQRDGTCNRGEGEDEEGESGRRRLGRRVGQEVCRDWKGLQASHPQDEA